MKKIKVLFLLLVSFQNQFYPSEDSTNPLISEKKEPKKSKSKRIKINIPKRNTVNQVVARVNGVNILLSDLQKIRTGRSKPFSIEEAINQKLFELEGIKRNLTPTEADIEKHIASIRTDYENQIGTKITDDMFTNLLSESGFTMKSYKNELFRSTIVANLLGAIVREKVFISAKEVEKYYDANPEYTEAEYFLKTCIVPFSKAENEEKLRTIINFDWVESGWLKKREIVEGFYFITDMQKGEISKPIKTPYGFQLIKLEDVRPSIKKPLEDRYVEIEHVLKSAKMAEFETNYANDLRSRAIIEYLN